MRTLRVHICMLHIHIVGAAEKEMRVLPIAHLYEENTFFCLCDAKSFAGNSKDRLESSFMRKMRRLLENHYGY